MKISPLVSLGKPAGVKDLIFLALGQESPLTVRKIHNAVQKSTPARYHAVHKAVRQFMKEGVLQKEKNGYLISREWLEEMLKFVEDVKARYLYNKPMYGPGLKEFRQEAGMQTFIFDTLLEADSYRKRLQWEYFATNSERGPPYAGITTHFRTPLIFAERFHDVIETMQKSGVPVYLAASGRTAADEWCADYYRVRGCFAKTGVQCAQNCEINVLGDFIVQIQLPEDIIRKIDRLYGSIKQVSDIDIHEFYSQVYHVKGKFKIMVMKNPELAAQLRAQIIANFNRESVALLTLEGTFLDSTFTAEVAAHLLLAGLLNPVEGQELIQLCSSFRASGIKFEEFVQQAIRLYAHAVKGKSPASIREAVAKFVLENSMKLIPAHACRLQGLIRSYKKTIAITRLPRELVQGLSSIFEFDDIISTELETVNGVFTGKILQNLCIPGSKDKALVRWLKDSGTTLKGSLAFGNRFYDVPFLSRAERCFLIKPDEKLAAFAKKKGWPVYNDNMDELLDKIREVLQNG